MYYMRPTNNKDIQAFANIVNDKKWWFEGLKEKFYILKIQYKWTKISMFKSHLPTLFKLYKRASQFRLAFPIKIT